MHLYILARGQQDWLERWKNDLGATFLPYKYKADLAPGRVRIGVRPIELLEIVYPEDQHGLVMEMVHPYSTRKIVEGYRRWLCRLLGLKSINNKGKTGHPGPRCLFQQYVSIVGIGTKKDARDKDGIELL